MNNYSSHASVRDMQEKPGYMSLEQKMAETSPIMMFKIIHGYICLY